MLLDTNTTTQHKTMQDNTRQHKTTQDNKARQAKPIQYKTRPTPRQDQDQDQIKTRQNLLTKLIYKNNFWNLPMQTLAVSSLVFFGATKVRGSLLRYQHYEPPVHVSLAQFLL